MWSILLSPKGTSHEESKSLREASCFLVLRPFTVPQELKYQGLSEVSIMTAVSCVLELPWWDPRSLFWLQKRKSTNVLKQIPRSVRLSAMKYLNIYSRHNCIEPFLCWNMFTAFVFIVGKVPFLQFFSCSCCWTCGMSVAGFLKNLSTQSQMMFRPVCWSWWREISEIASENALGISRKFGLSLRVLRQRVSMILDWHIMFHKSVSTFYISKIQ